MSSTGALPTNTAPLVLRVDHDNPLSINNTFVLNKYGKPVPAGTILLTGPNGAVRADTSISSFNVSSLTTREIFTSSIQASGVDIVSDSKTILYDINTINKQYVIQEGITSISFQIIGAAGSSVISNDPNSGIGGNAAYISGTIDVTSNNLTGKILNLQPGICQNGTKNSSSASYISIDDSASSDTLLVVAGAGGNGGYASTSTYQANGGGGGAENFNSFADTDNAGQTSAGLIGTTQTNQTDVTGGGGGQQAQVINTAPGPAPGGIAGLGNGTTISQPGTIGLYNQSAPVLGGSGGEIVTYYGGSGGGGYSGGGGGNVNTNGSIASGGGGGSSYYAANYIDVNACASGNNLTPDMLPTYGRASSSSQSNISNGVIILRINTSPALTTTGDIDCSGNITCNILKYSILDPPLYVKPGDAWSNLPAETNVDISNHNINNVKLLNVSTIFNYNGIQLSESVASDAARPALSPQLADYEIRALCDNNNDPQGSVGFLQLTAGNQPTTMSYIQLSGNSGDIDMDQNIVLGTSGAEQVRINSTGMTIQKDLYFFGGKSYIATNESPDGTYDGTYIEMTQGKPLKITNGITDNTETDRQYAYFSTVNSNVSNNFQIYSASTAPNSLNYFSTGVTRNITIDINTDNGDYGSIEAYQTNANTTKKPLILNGYSGGNVGINTDAPNAQLHVNGTGQFSNTLTVTSGGASITGNQFVYTALNPPDIEAFKIELHGANLCVTRKGAYDTCIYNGSGGNLILSTNQTVSTIGNATITGTLTANSGLTVTSGGANITGALTANNGLNVTTSGATIGGLLTANNGLTVNNGATINSLLTANNGATITGTLTANSGLTVTSGTLNMNNNQITNCSNIVNKIVAGNGISINPQSGIGDVTVNVPFQTTMSIVSYTSGASQSEYYGKYVIIENQNPPITSITLTNDGVQLGHYINYINNTNNTIIINTPINFYPIMVNSMQLAMYFGKWILPKYYDPPPVYIIINNNDSLRDYQSISYIKYSEYTKLDFILVGGGGGGGWDKGADGQSNYAGGGGGSGELYSTFSYIETNFGYTYTITSNKITNPTSTITLNPTINTINISIGNGGYINTNGNPTTLTLRNNANQVIGTVYSANGGGYGDNAGDGYNGAGGEGYNGGGGGDGGSTGADKGYTTQGSYGGSNGNSADHNTQGGNGGGIGAGSGGCCTGGTSNNGGGGGGAGTCVEYLGGRTGGNGATNSSAGADAITYTGAGGGGRTYRNGDGHSGGAPANGYAILYFHN